MSSADITLIGNVTADPEIRYFDSGKAKAEFTVAVNRTWNDANGDKQEQTSYFPVEAWQYLAEDVARVITKGVRVTVKGSMEQVSWNDKETGEKRSKFVTKASFIGIGLIAIDSFERRRGGQGETSVATTETKTTSRPAAPVKAKLPSRAPQLDEEGPF